MLRPPKIDNRFAKPVLRGAGFFLISVLLTVPAYAHKTEVSGDVAGTWHVEPHHSPKAGEPAQVWVALTQQGGTIIPLEECDCRLAIYRANATDAAPIVEPPLQAITAENYQGIPGANVIFPQVGEYQLKLTGHPRADARFQPFEFTYTVAVAAGSSPAPSPTPPAQTASRTGGSTSTASAPSDPVAPADSMANSNFEVGKGLLGLGALALGIGAVAMARCQRQGPQR